MNFLENNFEKVDFIQTLDLVTETDKLIEKTIIDRVKSKYPDHCFIGEESSVDGAIILTNKITYVFIVIHPMCLFLVSLCARDNSRSTQR